VDFPRLLEKLKAAGYDGPVTIEREIEGPEQKRDILAAARLLAKLL
jgi:sugar phosphate isomerase/epimerase